MQALIDQAKHAAIIAELTRSCSNMTRSSGECGLNQVRLQRARKLLLAGKSVAEAAGESGFYDQSRLTHLFKRAYGVTPARYANLTNL
jgi:AraC-like DNA-binding protein